MTITKSFLRHEIQNILTILGVQIEDLELETKEELLNQIRLISLFIEYESFLLNSEITFQFSEISIEDLFEILEFSVLEVIPQKKGKITFKKAKGILKIDREHLIKALRSLFVLIAKKVKQFECDFDAVEKKIVFVHDRGLLNLEKQPLEKILRQNHDYEQINLHLALHLLEKFGCKLLVSEHKVEVCFPVFAD